MNDLRHLRALAVALLALAACGDAPPSIGGDGGTTPRRRFAQPCEATEDCESGLCLQVEAMAAICTRTCSVDGDCPDGDNWGCVVPEGFPGRVCGCVPDADEEICSDGRDNECNGRVDDCRFCDGIPVPADDPDHCGECDNACGPRQLCVDEECVCEDVDRLLCAGECVDPLEDVRHCGACGNLCENDLECVDGECGCPAGRPELCEGAGCVDTRFDARHCGACGNECADGQSCIDGVCGCALDGPPDWCPGVGCVNLQTNDRHCGACGNRCTDGELCEAGACACPGGGEACPGVGCVDLTSNVDHCGACGNACGAGRFCSDGRCVCPDGGLWCDGRCVDPATDEAHCGSCGNACEARGEYCRSGVCACSGSATVCGDLCVNTRTSRLHCGACGNTCRPGEYCSAGRCACSSGLVCDGVCVPTGDEANCGACGNVCAAGQSCVSGECRCDGSGESFCGGSCVRTSVDEANCGACGNVCAEGQTCSGGECVCPSGQTFCADEGRCIDLRSDAANCGACGQPCLDGQTCRFGSCRCPSTNEAWCSSEGTCVDIRSNDAHCGGCDIACTPDSSCSFGRCRCPVAGQTVCPGDACRDLRYDATNCGSCGNACSAAEFCLEGACLCPGAAVGATVSFPGVDIDAIGDAAWNGTEALVVTTEAYWSGYLHVTRVGPDGTILGSTGHSTTLPLHDGAQYLHVVSAQDEWYVLLRHRSPTGLTLTHLGADGSRLGEVQLDSTAAPWRGADIAYQPGRGLVLAYTNGGSPSTLTVQRLTGEGMPTGAPRVLGSAEGPVGMAARPDGSLAVVVADTSGSPTRLRAWLLDPDLGLVGNSSDSVRVLPSAQPRVFWTGDQWLALQDDRAMWGPTLAHRGPLEDVVTADAAEGELLLIRRVDGRSELGRWAPGPFGTLDAQIALGDFDQYIDAIRTGPRRGLFFGVESFDGPFVAPLTFSDCP